jgi:cytochrome c
MKKKWFGGLIILALMLIFINQVTPIELTDSPECPQLRDKTPKAPDAVHNKINPLDKTPKNIKKGKLLYMVRAKTIQCKHCHGIKGDGLGGMAPESFPNPRNFTCAETMNQISDGQIFWAITNGISHTSMPSYDNLSEKQIWQLVMYIREFSGKQENIND